MATKKSIVGTETVFQIKITLLHVKPPVWRRIELADCSLEHLHDVIQNAMGWYNCHLWAFSVGNEEYGPAMDDDFLWGGSDFEDASEISLSELVKSKVKKFIYTYDFGDSWEHLIEMEKEIPRIPEASYPRCVKGKRACPPEDCGGSWRYNEIAYALKNDPKSLDEDFMEWLGDEFDPEHFDLDSIQHRLMSQ